MRRVNSLLCTVAVISFSYQKTGSVVQQTAETDGETPLQQTAVVRVQGLVQRDGRRWRPRLRGYGRVPHELSLQLLSVLGMHQLVDGLVHDVGLRKNEPDDNAVIRDRAACASRRRVEKHYRFLIGFPTVPLSVHNARRVRANGKCLYLCSLCNMVVKCTHYAHILFSPFHRTFFFLTAN